MVKYDETEDDEENPPDYRGMRQLQQQYQWSHECLDAGAAAYAKRKYRAAVDLYAAAYRHSGGSSGSFSFRYYCVYMVTNGLTQTDLNATEKDIRFLKEVLADENEEHASRVRVAVVLGALATNITDSITNLRRALEISVTMSKDQREARVVGPDPKEDADKFSQETSMVQTQQGVLVDALAQEARDHLTRIVGADAKELQVKVPELPPPAPPSICDPPGPAPEERPPAPKSEKEVKKMAKEKKKQEALLEAQKEAARRERALVRGRYAMGMDDPTAADRLFIAAPDLGLEQAKIDSMLKTLGVQCYMCGECALPHEPHEFCSKCHLACYCSRDCQKQHWKWRHKRECRPKEDFKPGDYACLDAKKVVDPAEYDDLAQHVGVGHGIWLIVGVLASYDNGRNVRVTMDGRDATSKVFGREVLCRLPPSSPDFNPQKLPLTPK